MTSPSPSSAAALPPVAGAVELPISSSDREKEKRRIGGLVEEAMETMDSWYPGFFDKRASAGEEAPTVCIPACPDVNKDAFHRPTDPKADNYNMAAKGKTKTKPIPNAEERESQIKGQNNERAFLRAFSSLKLGGLLVGGFNLKEFKYRQRMKQDLAAAGIATTFEVDALIFHPNIGMVILEIKSDETNSKEDRAVSQLARFKAEIPKIWQLLCGTRTDISSIPLYFALCFPNAALHPSDDFDPSKTSNNFLHIDKLHFTDLNKMKQFFTDKMTAELTNEQQLDLKKFACSFAAYRSGEFTSLYINAMKVHRLLNSIMVKGAPVQDNVFDPTVWNDGLMWTNKQLRVIEDFVKNRSNSSNHQLIMGLPGTGKTLVLLEAARRLALEGEKVFIVAKTEPLTLKFRRFFKDILPESVAHHPVIEESAKSIKDEKYIFVDEGRAYPSDRMTLKRWLGKLTKNGQSLFIVVNGTQTPLEFAKNCGDFSALSDVSCTFFNTILRSTRHVFEEYRQYYDVEQVNISRIMPVLGHNIDGQPVNRISVKTTAEALTEAIEIVKKLRKQKQATSDDVFYSQILIIMEISAEDQRRELRQKYQKNINASINKAGIPCGTILEQMEEGATVALQITGGTDRNILSMEWPIVIVVRVDQVKNDFYADKIVHWYSRCTSQLHIIVGEWFSHHQHNQIPAVDRQVKIYGIGRKKTDQEVDLAIRKIWKNGLKLAPSVVEKDVVNFKYIDTPLGSIVYVTLSSTQQTEIIWSHCQNLTTYTYEGESIRIFPCYKNGKEERTEERKEEARKLLHVMNMIGDPYKMEPHYRFSSWSGYEYIEKYCQKWQDWIVRRQEENGNDMPLSADSNYWQEYECISRAVKARSDRFAQRVASRETKKLSSNI